MIYFDNAATTPHIFNTTQFYNPSSMHKLGLDAERELKQARNNIADILRISSNEIIFTSGGTEANNLAILGYALANTRRNVHIYAYPYDHPSIIAPIKFAAERGWATSQLSSTWNISTSPALVSFSQVDSETGAVLDIENISSYIKKFNPAAVIHVDGAQGFCKHEINLKNIDMYTFSGHKVHGGVGAGGLWLRKGVRVLPLLQGGGQEFGLRPGTENVSCIANMSKNAVALHSCMQKHYKHVYEINMHLRELVNDLTDTIVNSSVHDTSPYILNMSILGLKAEVLVNMLSEQGLFVSTGVACRVKQKNKSALELMGYPKQNADSAIRLSFSHLNTMDEAIIARKIIVSSVSKLREML